MEVNKSTAYKCQHCGVDTFTGEKLKQKKGHKRVRSGLMVTSPCCVGSLYKTEKLIQV